MGITTPLCIHALHALNPSNSVPTGDAVFPHSSHLKKKNREGKSKEEGENQISHKLFNRALKDNI